MVIFLNARGSLVVSSKMQSFKKTILKKKKNLHNEINFLFHRSQLLWPWYLTYLIITDSLSQGAAFFRLVLWMNEGHLCLCFLGRILRGCLTLRCAY